MTWRGGVPLLFIHHVATDRRLWQHRHKSFFQRYRLITVDVMGHGERAWSPQEFSLEHTASHVRDLMARLEAGPAFVIGVSMGATIAMKLALSDPSLIRGLILVSPWSPDTCEILASTQRTSLIAYFDWLKPVIW